LFFQFFPIFVTEWLNMAGPLAPLIQDSDPRTYLSVWLWLIPAQSNRDAIYQLLDNLHLSPAQIGGVLREPQYLLPQKVYFSENNKMNSKKITKI
jgi:hypothetical protein